MKMIFFLFFWCFFNIFQVGQRGLEWRFQGGLGVEPKKISGSLSLAMTWNTLLIFTLTMSKGFGAQQVQLFTARTDTAFTFCTRWCRLACFSENATWSRHVTGTCWQRCIWSVLSETCWRWSFWSGADATETTVCSCILLCSSPP